MKLNKIILVLLLLPLLVLSKPKPVIAEPVEIIIPSLLTMDGQISYFSKLYQVDEPLVRKVIDCESKFKHNTSSDNGFSNGIMQFQKATFIRMAKKYGEVLDYNSQYDQLRLGIWAISKPELAREWTSYVAIQKGGVYSFYSRQLQKHFTVKCKL